MNVKRKLMNGALSAVLGISLVGGGTWAAFNDIEKVTAGVEAGTLDLMIVSANRAENTLSSIFNLSDLKPGDHMTRTFRLKNNGTLAIKDVLMSLEIGEFQQAVEVKDSKISVNNSALAYLDQFQVEVLSTGAEKGGTGAYRYPKDLIKHKDQITLKDLYLATSLSPNLEDTYAQSDIAEARNRISQAIHSNLHPHLQPDLSLFWVDNRVNVATINPDDWTGIPVYPYDPDDVEIKVKFKEVNTKEAGLFTQNQFQGNAITVFFDFEARQWNGLNIQQNHIYDGLKGNGKEGYIGENEKANSQTGNQN